MMRADACQERPVYLILAWAVEDNGMTGDRLCVAVVIVAMTNGYDVGGGLADCVSGGRRARVGDDRRLTHADTKTGVAEPDDLHGANRSLFALRNSAIFNTHTHERPRNLHPLQRL